MTEPTLFADPLLGLEGEELIVAERVIRATRERAQAMAELRSRAA